jgi:thiamine biosynthesis protein ThiS
MSQTVTVNDEVMGWKEDLTLFDIFRHLGYNLDVPLVLVRINGQLIARSRWNGYVVPEDAGVQVLNVLRGG